MPWKRRSREADLERESPEDARYAARRAFGSTARAAEHVREALGGRWIGDALPDVRFAVRLLARNRGFTAGAAVPLAFAIGCTACALTLVDAILFRSLGATDPGRMAAIYAFSNEQNRFLSSSYADFRDLQSIGSAVESAAAFVRMPVNVRALGPTERMNCEMVAGDYFRTVGVTPAMGRPLAPADQQPGAPPVALIGYSFWESRYQKSVSALGSTLWVNGVAFTIAGVMPRGYGGTLMDWYANPALWIPLAQIREILPAFRGLDYENRRDIEWLMLLARLREGASPEQLQSAANAVIRNSAERRNVAFVAMPANRARFFPAYRAGAVRVLWILVAVAAAALAIACFNLANLLLAHAASRQPEIGARLALGAGRFRLLRQFAIENAVLAGCACALGLPMAFALTSAADAFQGAFGLSLDLSPDCRALAVSALAGLATAILAGSAPAWTSSRLHLATTMKGGVPAPGVRFGRMSVRDVFVAMQVACAMIALAAAALVFQSLRTWAAVPLGYTPHGVLVGEIDALSAKLSGEERDRVFRAVLADIRSEASGAALASQTLPTRMDTRIDVAVDGTAGPWTRISSLEISDGYFELLNIAVIEGRAILAADDRRSRTVVALNQAAARTLWPGQNPIGRRLRFRGEATGREVVGLVADIRFRPLGAASQSAEPVAFLPIFQRNPMVAAIHVRTPAEPESFTPALRRIVGRLSMDMPLAGVEPLEERVQSGLSQVRLVSQATGAVAALGVALALGGIVAAGAYRVAQRKREIAVRIAIGAEPGRVIRTFVARGLLLGGAGAAAGLTPAMWASKLLCASLRGVEAPGALLFGLSGVALALASSAASWIAARRIARLQPADVLRMQ